MSNRIPIDNFGTPIRSKGVDSLSKPTADRLYLNVKGPDEMNSDLDLGGFQINNVDTPEDSTDATNKAYVDQLNDLVTQQIAALTTRIEALKQTQTLLTQKTNNIQTEVNTHTTKSYVDNQFRDHKELQRSEMNQYKQILTQRIDTCLQRSIRTIRFNLNSMLYSNVYPIGQNFFIVSLRSERRGGFWVEGVPKGIEIKTKEGHLYINKQRSVHTSGFTGVCEVLLMKGSLNETTNLTPNNGTPDNIGVHVINR